ncbi:MAG: 4-(cytidine 5'-diphospho)-2-C-methyl-D-erythritol kinase [Betaproteobacteria bacterium]|nr:4-(cytidine 5'-diphospho)-2-C-methyl-D-erythritol kinase [Betaproteobacteria bacterium]
MTSIENVLETPRWGKPLSAPAKLNLFLYVIGRRADGYHLLQTLFRFIDFADSLVFLPRDDGKIVLETPLANIPAEKNLAVRAARLLRERTGVHAGVSISLEKRLPSGGGLGGGSSDAATTLLALNHLWQTGLSRPELQALGLNLGADVPVFIFGQNAFAEGVGEELTPIVLPTSWYLLLFPPVAADTAAVFSSPDLRRDTMRITDWQEGLEPGHNFGRNDLEPVATALYPVIGEYLSWLRAHAGRGWMSGSGATVFAECPDEAAALALAHDLPSGWKWRIAKGLSQHPLLI